MNYLYYIEKKYLTLLDFNWVENFFSFNEKDFFEQNLLMISLILVLF